MKTIKTLITLGMSLVLTVNYSQTEEKIKKNSVGIEFSNTFNFTESLSGEYIYRRYFKKINFKLSVEGKKEEELSSVNPEILTFTSDSTFTGANFTKNISYANFRLGIEKDFFTKNKINFF